MLSYEIYSVNGYLLGEADTLEHAERLLYTWFNAAIVVSAGEVVLRRGYPPILSEAAK